MRNQETEKNQMVSTHLSSSHEDHVKKDSYRAVLHLFFLQPNLPEKKKRKKKSSKLI
jgi:hypothetical protein